MKKAKLIFLSLLILIGCSKYEGDGKFTKRPFLGDTYRYEVDFGSISLDKKGEYHFSFSGIPLKTDYIFSLVIGPIEISWKQTDGYPRNFYKESFANAFVDFQLSDKRGTAVISSRGRLTDKCWHWSGWYNSNFPAEGIGTAQFTVRLSPKGGEDTQFCLSPWKDYILTVKILEPTPQGSPPCRLLLQGGSWK